MLPGYGLVWVGRLCPRARLRDPTSWSLPVFEIKLLVLGVLALVIFGPERLPAMAAQLGRGLHELRKLVDGAKSELQENLGPEFSEFDLADLNPKHFVRKHLVNELTGDGVLLNAVSDVRSAASGVMAVANGGAANGSAATTVANRTPPVALAPGELPPYDSDAT
jgi:sec-independent protein translocase protein TatB